MNILVTNDDGIMAKGILSLVKALSEIGKVYVVAPDSQKSACGHGITMHIPMAVKEMQIPYAKRAWSVSGTPADCIKLGVRNLVEEIDFVVSGTNMGANLGSDCFYSGTVSGAAEGVFCNLPAVAMSICSHDPNHFEPSMKMAQIVVNTALEKGLEKGTMLNVNLPDLPGEEIKGVRTTYLGEVSYKEGFKYGENNMGSYYYWYNGEVIKAPQKDGSDVQAIRDRYVSISPLHFDITDYSKMKEIQDWDIQFK